MIYISPENCDQGTYYDSTRCVPCPLGKYGDGRSSRCTSCRAGKTTLDQGSKSESDCVEICGAGKYLERSIKSCKLCPKGTYNSYRQKVVTICQECSVGTYNSIEGAVECKKCDGWKTTRNKGSTSESDCFWRKFVLLSE